MLEVCCDLIQMYTHIDTQSLTRKNFPLFEQKLTRLYLSYLIILPKIVKKNLSLELISR